MGTRIGVPTGVSVHVVVGANLFRVCPFWSLPTLESDDETVEVFSLTFDTAQELKIGTFPTALFASWLATIKGAVTIERLGQMAFI